jgi:hypothetical protein
MMGHPKNLIYTICFDKNDHYLHAKMCGVFVVSLLKTYFTGDILIFRNFPAPIFPLEMKGVEEVFIDQTHEGWANSMAWKWRVAQWINASKYDKIAYFDCDCLALRNIDHLFSGEWDILYQPERHWEITKPPYNCFLTRQEMKTLKQPGVNAGSFAVRGNLYQEVMKQWGAIDAGPTTQPRTCSDQAAWNRLLLDTKLRKRQFERGEIQFPLLIEKSWMDYKQAAILHAAGGHPYAEQKLNFLYGMYAQTFHLNPQGTLECDLKL